MTQDLLKIEDLTVRYESTDRAVTAVDAVHLRLGPGQAVGIVGESGSGKSTLAHSLLRLLPTNATQTGTVVLDGTDLGVLSDAELRKIRGDAAAMVFQDPMTSFDPQRTIGYHLNAGLEAHRPEMTKRQRRSFLVEQLRRTELPEPEYQAGRYPHELSGGMRQRSMLALALQNSPMLLVADEPTTALDVTIQAQILRLFGDLITNESTDSSLLLISHDLAVVRQVCSRIVVMYAGRIVEDAPTDEIFSDPRHPYTQALIRATPRASADAGRLWTIPGRPPDLGATRTSCSFADRCAHSFARCHAEDPKLVRIDGERATACFLGSELPLPALDSSPVHHAGADVAADGSLEQADLVDVSRVTVEFEARGATSVSFRKAKLHALRDVSVTVARGETLGIVGESGSGKSTLARVVLGLLAPTTGTVAVDGESPSEGRSRVRSQQHLQAVFQDPHGSLNPRMTIEDAIAEPLRNLGVPTAERHRRVDELLEEVQLPADFTNRYPSELSGGQAQRVAIARALAPNPSVIVLDEPTSGLDISIQAHILNLLADLQERHRLTYVLISHDLTIVRHLADRIAVMYLGRIVELAETDDAFNRPAHPYTAALLSAVPEIDLPGKPRPIVTGEPPSPLNPPSGCSFHTRCPIAEERCATDDPSPEPFGDQLVACHFPGRVTLSGPLDLLDQSSLPIEENQ